MYPPQLKILPSLTSPLPLGDAITNPPPSLIEIDGMHHGGCLKIAIPTFCLFSNPSGRPYFIRHHKAC